ncbi:MAG TPA: amidase family protein [Jatrophihabitans sp.]|nr:amidase family protein [Jatrophihabitans sp.]
MSSASILPPPAQPDPAFGPATGRSEIQRLRCALAERRFTVLESVEWVLAAIQRLEPMLGAFLSVAGEPALQAAELADRRIARLGPLAWQQQPLLGMPISVKDLIGTRELPTTRGSLLACARPRVDAPAVARLRAAGAIMIGKTTTSEYGWSASTVCRLAPPTRNPWALDRTAGGSSGGAAAAVAAGLGVAALGTDGAGSIRIPAAFCGVVGYKPSYGRVPYVPAGAERLSHLGPIARSVADVAELAAVLAGPHRADPDSGTGSVDVRTERRVLRIGWLNFDGTTPEIRRITEQVCPLLTQRGHRVAHIEVPFADPYPALVDILAATEAAGTRPEDEPYCDPGRLAIVEHGRSLSGTAVMRAEAARLALRTRLRVVMECYDLLVMPTVGIEPFGAAAIAPPWAADLADLDWLGWSPASYPFNLTGQPAISLPVGHTAAGLPVGLQLVGPVGADRELLSAAQALEADLGEFPAPPLAASTRME